MNKNPKTGKFENKNLLTDVRISFMLLIFLSACSVLYKLYKVLQLANGNFAIFLIFLFGLIMILTVIMASTHELGHKYFAQIVSHGEIKLDITKFSHISFKNIEKQPDWKKRIISLGGVVFSEAMMLIVCLGIRLCGSIIKNCTKFWNCTLTKCTTELTMLVFTLVTLANLFPRNRNGRPNDGYYFLHPDEIKDEEF